jgi:hypothetical protein
MTENDPINLADPQGLFYSTAELLGGNPGDMPDLFWQYLFGGGVLNAGPQPLLYMGGHGGLINGYMENGLLVLDFADTQRRIADCCSGAYIRVRYRWTKGQFVEEGPRERGDLKPTDLKH